LYPFLYNTYPHIKKFQINKVGLILWDLIKKHNKNIKIFTNLTNVYATLFKRLDINFFHHFGMKESNSYDLSGNFSTCHGAVDIMIGMAKYLGFSKIVVMGCDYLGVPTMLGHFYSDYKPYYASECHNETYSNFRQRVKVVGKDTEILVILPKGVSSPDFNYDSYENYFGLERKYKNNYDFIDQKYIQLLRDSSKLHQTIMNRK
jgi:hypothetical protein